MMATDQPQTEQSSHLWAICHPPDTKCLTLFLTTETIQPCFSNWKIKFSWSSFSLTTAVGWLGFFFWPSIYSCDSSSKTFSQPPSHSRVCTHPHHRCTQRYKHPSLPIYTAWQAWDVTCCSAVGALALPQDPKFVPGVQGSTRAKCKDQEEPCTSQIPEQSTSHAAQEHCGVRAGR